MTAGEAMVADGADAAAATMTRKARETRATILAAAARLFAEKGYAGCSLREIAAIVGMKAGSVYYHFASKDELLDEVIDTGVERLRQNVEEVLARLGPEAPMEERLRQVVRVHVGSFLDIKDDANTFLRVAEHLPPAMKRRGRAARQAYGRIWHDLLAQGQRSGEVDGLVDLGILVPFLLQALNRVPEWFSPARMTIEGVCEVIFATVLRGILTVPGNGTRR